MDQMFHTSKCSSSLHERERVTNRSTSNHVLPLTVLSAMQDENVGNHFQEGQLLSHSNMKPSSPVTEMEASISPESTTSPPHFLDLPQELFFQIISFLGPTSVSLVSLAQVSRLANTWMTQIGDSMMHQARSGCFRSLVELDKRFYSESTLSCAVRHAKYVEIVRAIVRLLLKIVQKDFVLKEEDPFADEHRALRTPSSRNMLNSDLATSRPKKKRKRNESIGCELGTTTGYSNPVHEQTQPQLTTNIISSHRLREKDHKHQSPNGKARNIATLREIDAAMFLSMLCLGISPQNTVSCPEVLETIASEFIPITVDLNKILRLCPLSVEKKILFLCGKCGGKAFKFLKMRLSMRNEGKRFASDPMDVFSTHKVPTIASCDPSNQNRGSPSATTFDAAARQMDEERIKKSRMIMSHVLYREWELFRSR